MKEDFVNVELEDAVEQSSIDILQENGQYTYIDYYDIEKFNEKDADNIAEEATNGMMHETFIDGVGKIKELTTNLMSEFAQTHDIDMPQIDFSDDDYLELLMAMIEDDDEEEE